MSDIIIRSISTTQVRPLRQAILRPNAPPQASIYPNDDISTTLHVGAFLNNNLIGIASIFNEPQPNQTDPHAWRLRGMGVLASQRRKGYGLALLQACFAHIIKHKGTSLWCNARLEAIAFYQTAGFQIQGQPYQLAGYGTRYLLWRKITPP